MSSRNVYYLVIALCFILVGCKTSNIISKRTFNNRSNIEIKPQKLIKGDTIGLIAPGSYILQGQLNEAITNIENFAYKVKYSQRILNQHGYLAGLGSVSLDAIHLMIQDKDKAIVAVRGGYGCAKLLPLLDYVLIKNNPKIIIGYSYITSFLYGIFKKTGLVCFHGSVGTSTFNEYSVEQFTNILTKTKQKYVTQNLPEDENQIKIIKHRIALGVFRNCDTDLKEPKFKNSLTLEQVLQDRLGDLGVPVIYGLCFGHITNKFTIPFSINAELNADNKKLTLLENSVV